MMAGGPSDDRTPPMTPQLALRVALVGGCALVMFALIFFRLWFLQVLDGSHYIAQAQTNVVRTLPVAAPRGDIVGLDGSVLASSELVPAVLISPESLPTPISLDKKNYIHQPASDRALYVRLAKVLGISTKPTACKFIVYLTTPQAYNVRLPRIECLVAEGVAASQYANVTIKTNVPVAIQDYLEERIVDFRGVRSQDVSLRKYPLGEAGAQMLGTLGAISATQYGTKPFQGIAKGSVVGQSGLEYEYNQYLQGTDGKERIKVNSEDQFEGYAKETAPKQGDTLKVSIDPKLERVAQASLDHSISVNHSAGANAGAFVAMDPQTGQVYAMGSAPSFSPSFFTHPFTEDAYKKVSKGNALLNRATQGVGADGSTFKVITATAALESGDWKLDQVYDDNDCYKPPGSIASTQCLTNSGKTAYGPVNLETAIQDSVDTFFYNLGGLMNVDVPQGGPLQKWAKAFGIGQRTGVDLPAEASGTLPTPAWRADKNEQERECDSATGEYRYTNGTEISSKKLPGYKRSAKHAPGGCQIVVYPFESWTVGDNVNTAVGQGDDQVTPLQLAVVYSALANNGTVVTPHIGEAVQSSTGQVIQPIDPAPKRTLSLDPTDRQAILTGLHDATKAGTSADVMGDFPETLYGKTGTAQYGNAQQIKDNTEPDYAWYACFVPATATSKPITVVVWVEKGGFGDVAAAPVARQILSQWFLGKPGPYKTGSSTDL